MDHRLADFPEEQPLDELDLEARSRAGLSGDHSTWTPDEYRAVVREHMAMAHEAELVVAALSREMRERYGVTSW